MSAFESLADIGGFAGSCSSERDLNTQCAALTAKSATQCNRTQSPASFSEIREFFKLQTEIFSLLLL
jgi:hypothetical protein